MTDQNSKYFISEQEARTGILSHTKERNNLIPRKKSSVKLIYYTDPICSFCWAIEPQFRKFKLDYEDYLEVEYRMGGLLKDWEGFKDGNHGITCPLDVAEHWEEVAKYSEMSIDGDVWINTPLHSSYPASIAYKALLNQGDQIAFKYLRIVREMLFLENRDISNMDYILEAVERSGANRHQFILDFRNPESEDNFLRDIQLGKDLGIKGFPTFIFINEQGLGVKLFGASEYESYVAALEKALGKKVSAKKHQFSEDILLKKYNKLSTKEISILLNQEEIQTIQNLHSLKEKGEINQLDYKNGTFWELK